MPQPSGLLSVPSGDPGQGHGATRGGEDTPEARPVWGLGHTCPALRGSWHPCPAGRPRSFGGWGTQAPLCGGRGTRAPYEIREPGQETAAHPGAPSRCHIHVVGESRVCDARGERGCRFANPAGDEMCQPADGPIHDPCRLRITSVGAGPGRIALRGSGTGYREVRGIPEARAGGEGPRQRGDGMVELVVVGIVAGFLAGISPCILPVLPVVLVAGASPPAHAGAPANDGTAASDGTPASGGTPTSGGTPARMPRA